MSENDGVSQNQPGQPADQSPPTPPTPPAPATEPAEPQPSWRDRVFGVRSMIAVGLAGMILGAGAATTTALAVDGDRHDHHERTDRPGHRDDFGPGGGEPRSS